MTAIRTLLILSQNYVSQNKNSSSTIQVVFHEEAVYGQSSKVEEVYHSCLSGRSKQLHHLEPLNHYAGSRDQFP